MPKAFAALEELVQEENYINIIFFETVLPVRYQFTCFKSLSEGTDKTGVGR